MVKSKFEYLILDKKDLVCFNKYREPKTVFIRLKDKLSKLKQDGWELTNSLKENPYYFIRKLK
tara:strand:+ start:90 stop:278 length:189 start_codon:yes stop_codon:yes gene_type:complete